MTLVENIAHQLEEIISSGVLNVGDNLPSERTLAERLGVSRPSIREAKHLLISKGILVSKQGGGTYIASELSKLFKNPLMELLRGRPESRYEILELRHALDSEAAYYAAIRATSEEKKIIEQCFNDLEGLHNDHTGYAIADGKFHLSITSASHNVVLLHVTRSLIEILQHFFNENISLLFSMKNVHTKLTEQHRRVKDAILNGDCDEARIAAQHHIEFTEMTMRKSLEDLSRRDKLEFQASLMSGND